MKRAEATRKRIAQLHWELHRELLELTRPYLEPEIPGFQRYRREYEQDFRGTVRALSRSPRELRKRMLPESRFRRWARQADLLLIGDFHPFAQASRTALRLLRELHDADGLGCVALEAFPSSLQPALGAYHRGELSIDALIAEARRNEGDGFPWHHYIPIIEEARNRGIPVLGLNLPDELNRRFEIPEARRGSSDLERRDRWAAGILCDWWFELAPRGTYPPPPGKSRKALVLYGELHLAQSHLPRWIGGVAERNRLAPPDVRVIQQNHDGLFKAVTTHVPLSQPRAVQVSESMACILGAPPWLKLRSVVRAFESGLAESDHDFIQGDGDDDEWSMDEEDEVPVESPAEYVHRLSRQIAEVWGWKEPSADDLTVLTEDPLEKLIRSTELDARARRLLRQEVERGEPIWIPELRAVWSGGLSENDLAESAAWALLRERLAGRRAFRPIMAKLRAPDAETEAAWAIAQAFAFLGSLLVNPHRKCDLPGDLRLRTRWLVRELARRKKGGASQRLLKSLETEIATRRRALALLRTRSFADGGGLAEEVRLLSARLAGRIVALSLHRRLQLETLDHRRLSEALDSSAASPRNASELWQDLVRMADPSRLPARKSRW